MCDNHTDLYNFCENCGLRTNFDELVTNKLLCSYSKMDKNYCKICGISRKSIIKNFNDKLNELAKSLNEEFTLYDFIDSVGEQSHTIPVGFFINTRTKTVSPLSDLLEEFGELESIKLHEYLPKEKYRITDWLYEIDIDLDDGESYEYKRLDDINDKIFNMNKCGIQTNLSFEERCKLFDSYEDIVANRPSKKQKVV